MCKAIGQISSGKLSQVNYTLTLSKAGTRSKNQLHVAPQFVWGQPRTAVPHCLGICSISSLGSCGLSVFNLDAGNTVTVHFFDDEAAAAVVAGIADGGDFLQL